MPKYIFIFLLLLCTCCLAAFCQEDSIITKITAHFAESLPEATDLSELTSRLSWYKQHPINMNQATPQQLKDLGLLTALQISNFFAYIQTSGPLKNLLELQSIADFDLETISRLLFFVTLKEEPGLKQLRMDQLLRKSQQELIFRYGQTLEKQKGFRDLPGSRYLGGPEKLLLKYRYEVQDLLAISLTGDKDAGEPFLQGRNQSGFDFLSGSIAFYGNGRFQKVIAGDYSLQFGQGLSLWTGSSFGKGPDVAGVAKNETGLKPYTSTNELSFFRGLASTITLAAHVEFSSFISLRHLDASLSTTKEAESVLTTIGSSGLHRTATEMNNKGDLEQLLYGTALSYHKTGLDLGALAYRSQYSHAFITGTQRYRQYNFEGKELVNTACYYNYTFRNLFLFGETAQSLPGGLSTLNGIMASIHPQLSAVLLHRQYARTYHSFYAQALGENPSAANEQGIYAGLHFSKGKKWSSALYADFFHHPWAKYRIDTASSGHELMWQLAYRPSKLLSIAVKINSKAAEQNEDSTKKVHAVLPVMKKNYRLELEWKTGQATSLKNRVEVTHSRKGMQPKTGGLMVYQDVDYSPPAARFAATFRIAFFKTETYDNRIYAYEDDVLGGAGSGLYYGSGFRTFLNLKYRLSKQLRCWARYAVSAYPGESTIGSALDQIAGNKKSDVRLQIRWQF